MKKYLSGIVIDPEKQMIGLVYTGPLESEKGPDRVVQKSLEFISINNAIIMCLLVFSLKLASTLIIS